VAGEINFRGYPADKRDAAELRRRQERERKEAEKGGSNIIRAPQITQSAGKQSAMKNDGLNKKF
jgi:hypothetical protein